MTVKELIDHLQKFDPQTEVFSSITDPTDFTLTLSLDSNDLQLSAELFGDNVFDDYESKFDDDGNYQGKPILMIQLEC
jgi:hypothetical protein